jgi:hypothetical protein
MANRSAEKGSRFERACVDRLKELGLEAQRVPLSGAAGGMFGSDIVVAGRKIECKTRKRAWMDLFNWLPGNHALMIKADRTETLVVMSLETYADMLKGCW